jgi:hypothetical protein
MGFHPGLTGEENVYLNGAATFVGHDDSMTTTRAWDGSSASPVSKISVPLGAFVPIAGEILCEIA